MKKEKSIEKETINIVFICDEKYAVGTGVAVSSLKQCRNQFRNYQIFIITNDVSERNIKYFKEMEDINFSIKVINAKNFADYSNYEKMKNAAHVSTTALYKFNIPQIFSNLNKILYLDCDIIIRDDLTELYDTDITDSYAAVCEDMGAETFPAPYNRRLKIRHKKYFNSGVMLFNLSLLRDENVSEKLIEYKKNGINDYMDQDAFNVVFSERVVYFSFLYNMAISAWLPYPCDVLNKYYCLTLPSKEAYFSNAKILHYSSPEKPWANRLTIGAEEWLAEYASSPFVQNCGLRNGNVVSKNRAELEQGVCYFDLACAAKKRYKFGMTPVVSVIIPVYNAENYLGECIESLMVQTLQNVEFIFVDDGSTDNSLQILNFYQRLDNRIQVYTQQNQFAGVARNYGLSRAKGEYITFLDSDDVMLPDALELFYKRAECTNADIVIGAANYFTTDYNRYSKADWCLRKEYLPNKSVFSPAECQETLFQISAGAPWGKFYHRELLLDHNIVFPSLPRAEDFGFVYWSFCMAKRIAILDTDLILYRIIDGSGSLEDAKDNYPLAAVEGYQILWDTLKKEGKQVEFSRTFANYVVNGIVYALRTFKTYDAFKKLVSATKEVVLPQYEIDLENEEYFYAKGELRYLKEICSYDNAGEFLFRKYRTPSNVKMQKNSTEKRALPQAGNSGSELMFYKNEIKNIHSSWTYRIGRFITFVPRKVRGGIRCYQEHGWHYTWYRLLVHLRIRKS